MNEEQVTVEPQKRKIAFAEVSDAPYLDTPWKMVGSDISTIPKRSVSQEALEYIKPAVITEYSNFYLLLIFF